MCIVMEIVLPRNNNNNNSNNNNNNNTIIIIIIVIIRVEVLQGDTFYSMITNNDTEKIKFFLQDENLNTERSCVCSFRTNRQSCPLLVRLRVLDPQKCLVVALCLPSLRERNSFTTTHTPDMKYTHTHYSVGLYLGYEAEELIGRSWYSIIHPDDLLLSARGHKQLMQCEQVDLVLRVQDKQLNWVWLYIIATRDTQSHMITCSNYIISEVVAEELRHELGTVSSVSSPPSQNSQCSTKRPAEVSAESERRKNRRVSTAASSSLPYSPNSSFTSPAQDTGNIDFLCSSSAFCPFYPSPPQNIQWPGFDFTFLTPFCYSTEVGVSEDHAQLSSLSDSFLYLDDFNSFPALMTGSSRTFHAPEDYGWSGLLTSHPPALRYSEMEQAEISILAQQISSLASSFDSYCTKSSTHRSDHTPGSPSCDPETFLLDEEVIDSVMQFPRAMLEVQTLEVFLDSEKCSAEQHEFSLYSHTQQVLADDFEALKNHSKVVARYLPSHPTKTQERQRTEFHFAQECEMYYYRYENAEVSCCYKYLMFSYNIIFWLAGAAFIAIGFWAWSEKGILLDLTQVTRLHGFDPVWLVLLVGMVTFILGFAGCVGALRENICLLRFFSGVIGFIFFLELTAAVLALVFQEPLRKWISDFFIVNVKGYRDDIDLQNLIDSLQRVNHCCGADSPNDWNQNAYFNCSRTNPSRERCGVPFSCCISDPADTVVNTQCGYDIRESEAAKWSSVIYVKGCVAALEEWLPRNIYIVAGVFIVISLLQMVGIFLARNLISDIEKVKFNY
ncbi:hypothetical protein QTP70_031788 [Hemibagrus guttatus]|uniref:Tetraspanin-33 n=1 Tax=Hemibagrus guttatus TaxID=175788 RepID=A0AAE0RHX2_9TELE|nr:hypothetical protein QTP70_031788 [Hemibagrus guttatus]